jgi:hypothetical protein
MLSRIRTVLLGAALAATMADAGASLIVDTGPALGAPPLLVDANDWIAAGVSFVAPQVITGIAAWLNDEDGGGDFTVSLYRNAGFLGLPGSTPLFSGKGHFVTTPNAFGWNGISGVNWAIGAGDYWFAIEVVTDPDTLVTDSFSGLAGINPARPLSRYAFNPGSGYQAVGAIPFGLQISAVPEPATALLVLSTLGLAGFRVRRTLL